jgi:hypothetical protein
MLRVDRNSSEHSLRASADTILRVEGTMRSWKNGVALVIAFLAAPVFIGVLTHSGAIEGSFPSSAMAAQQASERPVYVMLWFDTEDYILPQSDDAAKRLAEFLSRQGIRATFKVVGEKGRVLERRGRKDVIAALARHEIGYHTNTHSQHPTVAEYENPLDWENGIEEFTRRERPGFEDLRRIFGQAPSCYGQAGGSWAPQSQAALKRWGVKVYLDEAPEIGLDGKPFWYGGILNIFNTTYGFKLRPNDDWSNLTEDEAVFQKAYTEAASQPRGGIISIHFHPCEFVHREFWDAVNFARGADPPSGQWKLPPTKTTEESEKAFKFFADFVGYVKSFPVRFVTASQGPKLMPDFAQSHEFSKDELSEIARQVSPEVSFQNHGSYSLSPSEVLSLLNRYVARVVRDESSVPLTLEGTPYGPSTDSAKLPKPVEMPWHNFSSTVLDVSDVLAKTGQVPNPVWVGSVPIPPESYLVTLAYVVQTLLAGGKPPETVTLHPATLTAAQYVAQDSPKLWSWIIYRPGFDGAHILEIARLQTWTLKPALMREPAAGPL